MTALTNRLFLADKNEQDATFDELFIEHYGRVYGLLFRLLGSRAEAEDIAQDVFLKLYQQPPRAADTNVSAWLYRVATNAGYNAIRSRKRMMQRNTLLLREVDSADNPATQVANAEEAATVRAVLAHLPERDGQLLLLRQMGLSYAELADACELNPNSVGKLLSRAAQAFKVAYIAETREKNHA